MTTFLAFQISSCLLHPRSTRHLKLSLWLFQESRCITPFRICLLFVLLCTLQRKRIAFGSDGVLYSNVLMISSNLNACSSLTRKVWRNLVRPCITCSATFFLRIVSLLVITIFRHFSAQNYENLLVSLLSSSSALHCLTLTCPLETCLGDLAVRTTN